MSTRPNPYETLGVEKDADQKSIKRAYNKLAMKYHPDTYDKDTLDADEASALFDEVKNAYEVLSDEDMRGKFDRGGWKAVEGGDARSSGYGSSMKEKAQSFGLAGEDENPNSDLAGKKRGKRRNGAKPSFK